MNAWLGAAEDLQCYVSMPDKLRRQRILDPRIRKTAEVLHEINRLFARDNLAAAPLYSADFHIEAFLRRLIKGEGINVRPETFRSSQRFEDLVRKYPVYGRS